MGRQWSACAEIDEMIKALVRLGWIPKKQRHIRLYSPDGKHTVTAPRSPSDHRAVMNFRADLRRRGIEV